MATTRLSADIANAIGYCRGERLRRTFERVLTVVARAIEKLYRPRTIAALDVWLFFGSGGDRDTINILNISSKYRSFTLNPL